MFAEERQAKILNIIQRENRVEVNNLSKKFDVSKATIRRDLKELETRDLLTRTYGGAVKNGNQSFEPAWEDKLDKYLPEKRAIARRACENIKDGDTILIDAGTTTAQMIDYLQQSKITLVTNSVHIINKVHQLKLNVELVFIGGLFKSRTQAMVGPLAEEFIKKIRVDKAFIGTNGFTVKDGATTPDLIEARLKREMTRITRDVYILFDHSKFNQVSFSQFADISRINNIITDKIDGEIGRLLEKQGVNIILAQ